MSLNTQRIRELNDDFRRSFIGGSVVVTQGVQTLGADALSALLLSVRQFDSFSHANDPYGEHDFGCVELRGERYFFKIDYYDRSVRIASPDAADPNVTTRILTIMRADEY